MESRALSVGACPMPISPHERKRNVRTALVLLTIALVFFAGIVARYWLYGA